MFDSIGDVAVCFNRTLTALGFTDSLQEDYIKIVGGNIDEIVRKLLKNEATEENISLVRCEYEKTYEKHDKENTKPYRGIRELLEKLVENNVLLAVNSNRKADSINQFIEKHLHDINFIAVEGHVPGYPSKPDSYGVNRILKKAGVTQSETVYIGDSKTDIQTARNAGIDCILVSWGYNVKEEFEDDYPLKVVDNPLEILEIILE